jgi:penicillin-binding protein 2
MRFRYIYILSLSFFVLLVIGLIHLTVGQGSRYALLSQKNCVRIVPQLGARGGILDRNGTVIAGSRLSYDVLIVPERLNQLERIIFNVSKILGRNPDEIRATFRQGFKGRSVPVKVAQNIDRAQAIALEELKFDMPGVVIQNNPVRNYPLGNLACHILGYVNQIDTWRLMKLESFGYQTGDLVGVTGIEEKYDYYLRPSDGGISVEVDYRGRSRRLLGVKQPRNGRDVKLTIDLRAQQIVESALGEKKGSVIILDPNSGAVVAMASCPRFFPSIFVEKSGQGISSLIADPDAPLINRGTSAAYPPGSIFKTIIAVAGLEQHKILDTTTYRCDGGMYVGKRFFKCWDTHGVDDLIMALAHSCDIFFYHTGLLLGPQAIHDYSIRFGLAKQTGLDVPYEIAGFIPSPKKRFLKRKQWFDGDTANFSIGQGDVLTTPLQMARMMAVFANRGFLVTPYLVAAVADRDLNAFQKKAVRLPFKQDTIDRINVGLRQVVENPSGTGHVLGALSIPVSGKTGTAQAPPGATHAWFAGFFPSSEPKYVICVLLDRGGPGHAACLVAKEIIEKMTEQGLV